MVNGFNKKHTDRIEDSSETRENIEGQNKTLINIDIKQNDSVMCEPCKTEIDCSDYNKAVSQYGHA